MNELVVKSFGSVARVDAYKAALSRATRNISTGDDLPILKVNKNTGEWSFGEDDTLVEKDDLWAVHPVDIRHGYIAFDGKAVAETVHGDKAEQLFSVEAELPHFTDLPELDIRSKKKQGDSFGWRFQMAIKLVCVEGFNKGAQVVYKPTSQGGLKLIGKLTAEILRAMDEEDGKFVPVIELDARSYVSQSYGNQIAPLAHIIEWAYLDDTHFASGRAESEDDTKSTRRARGDAKPSAGKASGNGKADRARADARDARKTERDARGEKVDTRRSSRDEEDEPVDDERAPRGRTRRDDEPVEDERPARGRRREEPADDAPAAEAPRGRRAREEAVEDEPEAPRGRRAARGRDAEDEPVEDAPRSRRGASAEDDRPAGRADERRGRADDDRAAPRGRNAERGGRTRH